MGLASFELKQMGVTGRPNVPFRVDWLHPFFPHDDTHPPVHLRQEYNWSCTPSYRRTPAKRQTQYKLPYSGIYGLVLLIIALVPLYYIHVPPVFSTNPEGRLEDLFYAWKQINMEPMIAVALSGTTISIAFFNYAGVSVTKELSATTRTVIDSIRTIVIWAASIPLFHAKFIPYQIIGFVLLLMGMFIYNDIVLGPWIRFKFLPEKEPESRDCSWCCFKFWGMHLLQEEEEEAEIEDAIEMKRRRATTVLSGEVEVEQRM
ncbi:hypothetical protein Y032_0074g878 [Ancylostoma ceylanicum]|nr:hypothetical protein Y032_0074g878 [Ancylostoma ceylanicum]